MTDSRSVTLSLSQVLRRFLGRYSDLSTIKSVQMLFKGFPDDSDVLKKLRNGTLEMGLSARWATEWEEHARPLITEVILFL